MINKLFINQSFFLLWIGQIISKIGDKFYTISLAWWILQKTNSPIIMGLLMASSILPGLIIGLFAGVFIDRWYRKPIMITADIIRGILMIIIAGFSCWNILQVWHVFMGSVILSLSSAFFDPAGKAIIPQIVSKEQLSKANGLKQMIEGTTTVIGPLLGGLSVSIFGTAIVFLGNGVSYLVSAICIGLMDIPRILNLPGMKSEIWQEVKGGLLFLTRQKRMLIIIIVIGVAHFFVGSLFVLLPFLAKELAGNGVRNLGYLETMMGLGLLLGLIRINSGRKNGIRDRNLFLFLMLMGFCYTLIGGLKSLSFLTLVPYLILMLFVGVAITNASIYWESLLQLGIPDELAGRIFSISAMIGNTSLPLAFGIFGLLLSNNSMQMVMIFSGICLVGLSCLLMCGYQGFGRFKYSR